MWLARNPPVDADAGEVAARARRPARCREGDGPGSYLARPGFAAMTNAASSGVAVEDFHTASRMSTITEMAILVVDDDQAVRDALRRALTMQGYDVDLAADGEEALLKL